MGRSISVRLSASTLAMIVLLGLTWIGAASGTDQLRVSYTHTVLTLDTLTASVLYGAKLRDDEETGLRGYLLTGQPDFLQPYRTARQALPTLRHNQDALLAGDPSARPLVTTQRGAANAWDHWAARVLSHPLTAPRVSAALIARQRVGKTLFDRYRAATDRTIAHLSAERLHDLRASVQTLTALDRFFSVIFGVSIALGLLLGWRTTRAVARPLSALRDAARTIGRGDFTRPVTIQGAREFTALAAEMDAMRRQLYARAAELASAHKAQRANEERLRVSAAELKRSNAELAQFAYVASHDLQEPLRAITSYLQLLKRRYTGKALDAGAGEYMDFAIDGARRMSQLIQDVLAYSRAGSQPITPASTDCRLLVERAIADLRVSIADKGARVTYDGLPVVRGDAAQLGQLFQNLIGNALKFQRPGVAPDIVVAATRQGAEWVIAVRDNGIGIPADQAGRIFQMFQRLHTRTEYEGTGIGLSICQRIVERHGGRVWVESEPGMGATFLFSLPSIGEESERSEREESAA